jgi:hypothetical protein
MSKKNKKLEFFELHKEQIHKLLVASVKMILDKRPDGMEVLKNEGVAMIGAIVSFSYEQGWKDAKEDNKKVKN